MPVKNASPETKPHIDQDNPRTMKLEMLAFLERYGSENGGTDKVVEGTRGRLHHLLEGAQEFDEKVYDFETSGILLSSEQIEQLERAREAIGPNFVHAINQYYGHLEHAMSTIIEKIQTEGMKYMMDGTSGYNEDFAQDMDGLMEYMTWGYRELSQKALSQYSPEYAQLNIDLGMKKTGSDRMAEILSILKGEDRVGQIANGEVGSERIEQGRIERIKDKMLALIKNTLHQMHDDLAGQAGCAIEKHDSGKYNRSLDMIRGGALGQLEFLLTVLIRSVQVTSNVKIQRSLLPGEASVLVGAKRAYVA